MTTVKKRKQQEVFLGTPGCSAIQKQNAHGSYSRYRSRGNTDIEDKDGEGTLYKKNQEMEAEMEGYGRCLCRSETRAYSGVKPQVECTRKVRQI